MDKNLKKSRLRSVRSDAQEKTGAYIALFDQNIYFTIEKTDRVWYNSMDFTEQSTQKEKYINETWYRRTSERRKIHTF